MIGASGKLSAISRAAALVAFLAVMAAVLMAVMSFVHYHYLQLPVR
jgi:hypothetical protein